MAFCLNCGAQLSGNGKFCLQCGTPVPPPPPSEPQPEAAAGGVSIGSKNVIAGDVIGKKEDYHVAGSMINKTILNETDKVLSCNVCGKHITNVEGFTCSNCGKIACRSHFNQQAKLCNACLDARREAAAAEYKTMVSQLPIVDGSFKYSDIQQLRWKLYEQGYRLPDKLANEIEEKILRAARGITDVEKIELEQCCADFDANRLVQACKLIAPIYDRHPDEEQVLTLYLRVIKKVDPNKGREVIQSLKVDVPEAYLASADIFLQHKQMEDCEKVLDTALKKWPDNVLVNSAMARHLAVCACVYKNSMVLAEADKYIAACGFPTDSYEKGSVDCAKAMVAYVRDPATADFGSLSAYWASFLSLLTNEVSVAADGTGSYTSLTAAIGAVSDGAVITVKPGVYQESVIISKNVTLIGVKDSFGNNPRLVKDDDSAEPLAVISANAVKISDMDFVGNFEIQENYFGPALTYDQVASVETLLKISSSDVTLENVNVHHSKGFGLVLQNAANLSASGCNFFRNAHSGCFAIGECSGTISNSFFAENGDFGYQFTDSMGVTLENSFDVANRFGYFTDERDGEVYRTVKIGKQVWMADNLRFDGGEGCYFYGDSDEDKKRNGAYYTWNALTKIADKLTVEQSLCSYNKDFHKDGMRPNYLKEFWTELGKNLNKAKLQGIAPSGWRIPTTTDFGELISFCQTNSPTEEKNPSRGLLSISDSSSNKLTDYFGFSAYTAGGSKFNENQMEDYCKKSKMWALNVNLSDAKLQKAFAFVMNERSMDVLDSMNRGLHALNLRCILDEESAAEIATGDRMLQSKIDYLLEAFDVARKAEEMWNRMNDLSDAECDKLYNQIEAMKAPYNL